MATQQRMLFVDNLRLGAIVLVVCIHAAVTYSGLGHWYYKEGLPLSPAAHLFFVVFQCFLQAFFMGTLFMVAGYYAAASLKAKGTSAFVKGRLVRLGVPTLFYALVIQPLTVYFLVNHDGSLISAPFGQYYLHYVGSLAFLGGTGPMWFALALLIFCLAYALAHRAGGLGAAAPVARRFPPGLPLLLALAAGVGAFALRLKWPIGSSVLNMQLCFFSQYVVLFCFGIAAHGSGWLAGIDYALGRRYLAAGLLGVPLIAGYILIHGGFEDDQALRGGFTLASALFAGWESCVGVFMSVGLVGVLRVRWNSQGCLTKSMSDSAFAVYMFHTPILVGITLLMRPLALPALGKFLLACALALPACFIAARVLRALPLVRGMVRS